MLCAGPANRGRFGIYDDIGCEPHTPQVKLQRTNRVKTNQTTFSWPCRVLLQLLVLVESGFWSEPSSDPTPILREGRHFLVPVLPSINVVTMALYLGCGEHGRLRRGLLGWGLRDSGISSTRMPSRGQQTIC